MFAFGTGNVLWKIPQKSFGVATIIVMRTCVSVLLMGGVMLFTNDYFGSINDWLIAIVISAVSFLGLTFYNLSIKYSTVSQSITVTSISAVFGVLTSILMYNEAVRWELWVSLLFIVVGLFFLEKKKPIIEWSKGVFYALLAAFFWGTTFALFRVPVKAIGGTNFSFVLESTVLICAIVFLIIQKKNRNNHAPTIRTYLTIFSIGVLGFIGVLFYNKAVTLIDVSILSLMGAFTPILSIVMSHIILKERFQLIQYFGMVVTTIAVLLLIV